MAIRCQGPDRGLRGRARLSCAMDSSQSLPGGVTFSCRAD